MICQVTRDIMSQANVKREARDRALAGFNAA